MVFYQTNNEKAWLGPVEVTDVDNNYIFVKTNGDRRKVPKCNVKLNVKNNNDDDEVLEIDEKEEKDKEKEKVKFEEGIMTCAKQKLMEGNKSSVKENAVAMYWMTAEQRENFEIYAVYRVEIPAEDQNTPEIDEAKHKEIENLIKFNVFEEVDNHGQERILSRWVVTQKEKADGQKSQA